eukprot:m.58515 g.58515  ORF g.58515 m.58515 type:complete len:302 (+) comp7867_c0_seq1:154-1059(+)
MVAEDISERLIAKWRDTLERACGYDSWGQIIEASLEYNKITDEIKEELVSPEMPFSERQALFLNKTAVVTSLRSKCLDVFSVTSDSVTLKQMQALLGALKSLSSAIPSFPVQGVAELQGLTMPQPVTSKEPHLNAQVADDDDEEEDVRGGTLLPRPKFAPAQTAITIRIDKIEIKDASSFIEPFFTVSTKDAQGKDLSAPQNTPPTNKKDNFVHFNTNVYIQVPLESFPEDGGIFLEFKHYKPKKHKTSVKCFCILEKDELKNGTFPLEIYAKPTDFKRKRLQLLTDKSHYLHVTISTVRS